MDFMKYPKWVKGKYDKKVRGQAFKKVKYDLNKANKSLDDISDTKLESMVAHKEVEIKAGHKTKGYKYALSLTSIPLVINVVKNLRRGDRWSALWGGSGGDDDDIDV